jgi:hypothetical protein
MISKMLCSANTSDIQCEKSSNEHSTATVLMLCQACNTIANVLQLLIVQVSFVVLAVAV